MSDEDDVIDEIEMDEIERLTDEVDRLHRAFRQAIAAATSGQPIQFTGCTWCGAVWPRENSDTAGRIKADALAHATTCQAHPLRIERDRLASIVESMQADRDALIARLTAVTAERDELAGGKQ